jgi:hypothetical protein
MANARHFAHLTFDHFHGFLGLPIEFEVELPPAFPSARYSLQPMRSPQQKLPLFKRIFVF